MSYFEHFIKQNIDRYKIDRSGYADLRNYDPQEELEILSKEDENLMDEVFSHHLNDPVAAQIDLVKAINGDYSAAVRFLAAAKIAAKSYFSYRMDDLGCEELLEEWQKQFAQEYAKEAAIEARIEQAMEQAMEGQQ